MLRPFRLYWVNLFTRCLPPTRLYGLKRSLFRWAGVQLGDNVRLVSGVKIVGSGKLSIGDNSFVGHDTMILLGGGQITIGRDADISSRVTVVNGTHHISTDPDKAAGDGFAQDIQIGDGVWVGVSATIIGGAKVGKGSIVAAAALVNGEVPEQMLVGGVPAKIIRNRHDDH